MAFEFGTSYLEKKPPKGPPSRKSLLTETPEERYRGMAGNSPFATGVKAPMVPAMTAPTPPTAAPVPATTTPPIAQTPPVATPTVAPPGAPDWLHAFITQILGPAIQGQNQNQAAAQQGMMQFRNDATFGRHFGLDGQPIAQVQQQPLSFDSLRVPLADRIAKEQATFGASFTGGDRVPPTMQAQAATQPLPQNFGAVAREQGMRPPQNAEASWGSPVYRDQHPEYNMFQPQYGQVSYPQGAQGAQGATATPGPVGSSSGGPQFYNADRFPGNMFTPYNPLATPALNGVAGGMFGATNTPWTPPRRMFR